MNTVTLQTYSLLQNLPFGEVGGAFYDYVNGQYYCIVRNNNKIISTVKFNVTH